MTSIPTVVRYGERRTARVRDRGGSWREILPEALAEYVSEELNPENEKGVAGVELFVPSALLESGMCLVDTPGLGSPFQVNTAATRAFVPHIDVAIVVIGADPPLGGEELDLVETIARQIPDLLVVLNKADRVSETERAEASAFAQRVLARRLRRPMGRVFEISAKERLDGVGPPRDWDAFVGALAKLARCSGRGLAAAAAERGLRQLGAQLLFLVAQEREALVRPVEESERQRAILERTVADAEQAQSDLGYLLAAEHDRLVRAFADRHATWLERVRPVAAAELAGELRGLHGHWGPMLRRTAMRIAQGIVKRHVLPWLQREQEEAEAIYGGVTERFTALAENFLLRLGTAGTPALAHLSHALDEWQGFATQSRFYFNDLIHLASPASPFLGTLDAVFGIRGLTRRILADAERFLDRLLETNSSRVQNDLHERVLASRRRLESEVRALLREALTSADRALARARSTRAAGAQAVERELARLARLDRAARELVPDITPQDGPTSRQP